MSLNSKDLILFFSNQLNRLRKNPSQFAKLLHQRLTLFKDEYTYERNDIPNILYKTQQGKSAVRQAIEILENAQTLKPLTLSMELCEIAYHISLEMSKEQRVDEPSDYKDKIKQSIEKHHCTVSNLQIIVEYGFRKDYQIVQNILVDDGNDSRSRRQSLMNPSNRFAGIGIQEHAEFDFIVLILLTEEITVQIPVEDERPHCECALI